MRSSTAVLLMVLAPLATIAGCERVFGTAPGKPARVADLQLVEATTGGLTVRWTQVSDGGRRPADYSVVVSETAFVFSAMRDSGRVVAGTAVDSTIVLTIDELDLGKEYRVQVAAFRLDETGELVFGPPSDVVMGRTNADSPGVVDDLEVATRSSTSISLQWTQVEDGTGSAANYRLKYGTPAVDWNSAAPAVIGVNGSTVGSSSTVSVSNLSASTTYEFQLESVAGSTQDIANVGTRSNVATATTDPATPAGGTEPFFSDNFDNGTRTNANGFTWSNSGSRASVSSVRSLSGSYSTALRFGPDSLGEDSSAEARFSLGRNVTELWIEYFLYIPANFEHRSDSPSNNKFFRVWGDSYSSSNKVGASIMRASTGQSNLQFEYNYKTWGSGTLGIGPSSPAGARSPFAPFAGEDMRDRWTRIRLYLRQVSATDADDGILRVWIGDAIAIDFQNVPQKFDPTRPFWNAGYLMGWANSGYTNETIFYIDDVKFFSQNPGW